ncbi:MAG: PIG-L family deacetylase [Acidimicrobiia bacterium]|nr:PIG-L family deacetylase [Acidimicrobiia bacterium]
MATLVCFHAHPDDEAIATGGTMAAAAAAGHRVVLVVATRGEQGEPVPGVLGDGELLGRRREAETHRSAEILGAQRVVFLDYEDSGMMGEPTNDNPRCFWRAGLDEASDRLATLLDEERCDVLTIYDANGGYGHPDHIQVHRVGAAAARSVGVDRVYQATMNRTHIQRLMASMPADGTAAPDEERRERAASDTFGMIEDDLTHAVDVRAHLHHKRASMMAHASQISEESFFLAMPPEAFDAAFGVEWYARLGTSRALGGSFETSLFTDLS